MAGRLCFCPSADCPGRPAISKSMKIRAPLYAVEQGLDRGQRHHAGEATGDGEGTGDPGQGLIAYSGIV